MKKAVIYARVSTDDQTSENQLQELRASARRHGWEITQEFVDNGMSGAKGRDQRPAFNALWKAASRKEFDMVMVWAVDRLGRSLQHLIEFLSELHAKKIDLFINQQGIDTTTPGGKALFSMLGVFGEFERSLIQERVKAGIKRARAAAPGKPWGRRSYSLTDPGLVAMVHELRAKGTGMKTIAKAVGISSRTVWKLVTA